MYASFGTSRTTRASRTSSSPVRRLSPSPCLRRVRELIRRGSSGAKSLRDPDAVGLPVSTFIQITLDKQVKEALDVFEAAIRNSRGHGVLPYDR